MNRNQLPAAMANHLSSYGRYGDDQLVHMNGQEVAALNGIAAAFGRNLTRNPHTGMTEAFNLFDVLPIALQFIPGVGTAAGIALSAASGAASAAVEGNDPLQGALMGGVTGALGAGLSAPTEAATKAAADATAKTASEALSKPLIDAAGNVANAADVGRMALQTAPTPIMPDIFGAGSDAAIQNALGNAVKTENLPYLVMGASALDSMMTPSDSGPGRPEYKYIPEQFPGSPRVVNPDYDPTMAAFGEQDAFSSGVDYARGYADGGEVKKGGGGFNIEGMLGGVIPMIIDGFTDGNKYGSGILGMLLNERKPWEYGRDRGGPQPMTPGPSAAIPAPGSSMPSPISGFAYGGPVRGYKGGGRVEYPEAPEGYMWEGPTSGSRSRLRGQGGKTGQLVPDPNFRQQPRQRNIQPTNPNSLYAGGSPLIGDVPMTQVPLPGGQMGAPPPAMGMSSPAPNYSSFEIATSPTGEMPASGGGMGGQGYQGGAQQGGKSGGSRVGDGGGKRGNIGEYVFTDPKRRDAPQINPGNQGAAPGQAAAQPEQPSTLPPMGAGVGMGMAYGGRVRGYANGGMVDQAMQLDDRTVVKEAMAALSGQSPNPEEAIAMFVDRFGEDALQALMQKMQGGMQGRYMQGPGDGLSDSIPATVDGQQPSALSSGEFVIPADAVSHLGNGSNESGAKELYSMIDRLRQARTGSPTPPPAIDQRGVMPA